MVTFLKKLSFGDTCWNIYRKMKCQVFTWGGVGSVYGIIWNKISYELKLADGYKRVHYTIFVYVYIFCVLEWNVLKQSLD